MSFLRRSLVLCRPAIGNGDTREIKQRRDRGVDPRGWIQSLVNPVKSTKRYPTR